MTAERFDELVSLRSALEIHAGFSAIPHLTNLMIDQLVSVDSTLDVAVAAALRADIRDGAQCVRADSIDKILQADLTSNS